MFNIHILFYIIFIYAKLFNIFHTRQIDLNNGKMFVVLPVSCFRSDGRHFRRIVFNNLPRSDCNTALKLHLKLSPTPRFPTVSRDIRTKCIEIDILHIDGYGYGYGFGPWTKLPIGLKYNFFQACELIPVIEKCEM